jgi:cbb3-type cytochrome oxidase subunit 3
MTIHSHINDEERDTAATLQPIPLWIKQGGAGLLILIILTVIWIAFSGSDKKADDEAAVINESIEKKAKPIISANIDKNAGIKSKLDQPFNENNAELESNTKLINVHNKQLAQLQNQLQSTNDDLTTGQQKQDSEIQHLKTLYQSLNGQITSLSETVKQLKNNFSTKRKVNKVFRTYRPLKTPFTLVSVDQWGSDLYAIIRYQNQLHELTLDQSLAGWSIESIDRRKGTVSIKNRSGRKRRLSINT